MKCVCGYEEIMKEDDFGDLVVDNTPFRKTQLVTTVNEKQGGWDCDRIVCRDVYMCPSCGNLKVDLNEDVE